MKSRVEPEFKKLRNLMVIKKLALSEGSIDLFRCEIIRVTDTNVLNFSDVPFPTTGHMSFTPTYQYVN